MSLPCLVLGETIKAKLEVVTIAFFVRKKTNEYINGNRENKSICHRFIIIARFIYKFEN
jgi:hypothetical protein